ncbi:MAG: GntR family transcriptional regulator [Kordiimonadaceae bacterium]|nr:GntR family transcriptional regulator [Kordiimonadaceae bacterium]MBO6568687.1 GntR family transcriptional regulator [Kordiimonadaceae bacterium]MBO6965337.1 GntR family transcriptional regulator [Kordiimonadaceae bacterium]
MSDQAPNNPKELASYVHETVYDRLREALMAGELAPGRAISVRRLAAQFDVSAMPAREAIRRLVALGALELTATRRVMVSQMTKEKLSEIKAARLALEPLLATKTIERIGTKTRERNKLVRRLQEWDDKLDGAIREGDINGYARYNRQFHFELYGASGAAVMFGLVESLWLQIGPFMRQVVGRLGTTVLVDDKHKDIIGALKAVDAEALAAAVAADVDQGMNTIDVDDLES